MSGKMGRRRGVQAYFDGIRGVLKTKVGYANGNGDQKKQKPIPPQRLTHQNVHAKAQTNGHGRTFKNIPCKGYDDHQYDHEIWSD